MSKYLFISHLARHAGFMRRHEGPGSFDGSPQKVMLSMSGDSTAALIDIHFGHTAYAGTILILKSTAWGECVRAPTEM